MSTYEVIDRVRKEVYFKKDSKVVNDAIHGSIRLPGLCIAIIDTPQFQRLRYLKQLGPCSFVYPSANHTRFEHSLGVSYLAGQMAQSLCNQDNPDLGITASDILCVQVAGLCHDLGHGPFSHLFEIFVKEIAEQKQPGKQDRPKWKHEDASIAMLDHLLEDNDIRLEEYGLDPVRDLAIIKDLILGVPQETAEKKFLYQIVSNQDNGIDVDKWDYFLRDSQNLGLTISFSYKRLLHFCRVVDVPGKGDLICYRDKEVEHLLEMFYTRCMLHRKAYQHRTNQIIDCMLVDMFVKVDELIKYKGKNGYVKLSDTVTDMVAFTDVTDDIFLQVKRLDDDSPKAQEAKEIVNRIITRKLYREIECISIDEGFDIKKKIESAIERLLEGRNWDGMCECTPSCAFDLLQKQARESLIIKPFCLSYGMANPFDGIWFYEKQTSDEGKYKTFRHSEKSTQTLLDFRFDQRRYRIISRSRCKTVQLLLRDALCDVIRE